MTNYIIDVLERKQHCAAFFVDLSKVFDSVDHGLLLNRLRNAGLLGFHLGAYVVFINDLGKDIRAKNTFTVYTDDNVIYVHVPPAVQVVQESLQMAQLTL